jgi:hypothetical protein
VPVPEVPQTPLVHCEFALHTEPAPTVAPQVPEAPGLKQMSPDAQSELEAHAVLHAVALAQMKPPGHAAGEPVLHVFETQVSAGVSMPLLHEAVVTEQSAALLHSTQVPAELQTEPPLSLQGVPCDAFAVVQQPLGQTSTMHREDWVAVQSASTVHDVEPGHVLPLLELLLDDELLLELEALVLDDELLLEELLLELEELLPLELEELLLELEELLLLELEALLEELVVPPVPEPPAPPVLEPPVLLVVVPPVPPVPLLLLLLDPPSPILLRSTDAMISQPMTSSESAPEARIRPMSTLMFLCMRSSS